MMSKAVKTMLNERHYCTECRQTWPTFNKAANCCPFVGAVGTCYDSETGPCPGCGAILFKDPEFGFECAECWLLRVR